MHIVRKHKRNKALVALFFPVAIFLFLLGWSLSWIGSQRPQQGTRIEPPGDNVHLSAAMLEEPLEVVN